MATNEAFEGKRITLLDGTKDKIVTVTSRSYKLKSGLALKANQVAKEGRSIVEVSTGSVKKKDKKAPAKKTTKKVAKSGKKIDWDSLNRREVIKTLVELELVPTRSALKGLGVDEMRIIGAKGKKYNPEEAEEKPAKKKPTKKKPAKKEAVERRRVRTTDEEKPAKKKPTKKKLAKAVETEYKTVKRISEKLARRTEALVEENIEDWLKEITGYDFTVACVGGVFNESRLTIQVGMLPTDASDDEIAAYSADMTGTEAEEPEEDNGVDAELEEDEDTLDQDPAELAAKVVELTGADESKVAKFVANWFDCHADDIDETLGDEVMPGMRMANKDGDEFVIIGWLPKKQKVAAFSVEDEKMVPMTLKDVTKLEFIEDEEEDDELDVDLDDDLEDEEFDEEENGEEEELDEDDLDEDEEDDLDEEDDEDEDLDEDDLDEEDEDLDEDLDEDEDFDEDDL